MAVSKTALPGSNPGEPALVIQLSTVVFTYISKYPLEYNILMAVKGYEDTIHWYEENAGSYVEKSKKNSENDKVQLAEFISLLPVNAKVLDAGCGGGRDTNRLQERGIETVGLDITHNLIQEAKKNFPQCNFVEGDILQLPFDNESFQGVWAHASLVHFDQDEQISKAINEFSRVLKKDGILHILVRAQKGEKKEVKSDSISQHERFYRNFTQDEIREFVENSGFEVTNIRQYDESKLDPNKRPGEGIEWILILARKI